MGEFLAQYKLSKREVEIVDTISKGVTNKEAADKLNVTEKTIKFHLTNIYRKMGIKSRGQLIVKVNFNTAYKEAAPAPV
jgi:LuxR family transcriptional regulator, positive regulator of biofilm formation